MWKKLKYNLYAAKNSREKDFTALGKLYYKAIKDAGVADEQTRNLVAAIEEKNEKIQELNYEISMAKNKKVCPNCGSFISFDSSYCKKCGNKV